MVEFDGEGLRDMDLLHRAVGGYVGLQHWAGSFQRPATAAYTQNQPSGSKKFQIGPFCGALNPILYPMGLWAIWDQLKQVKLTKNWNFAIIITYFEHFSFYEKKLLFVIFGTLCSEITYI